VGELKLAEGQARWEREEACRRLEALQAQHQSEVAALQARLQAAQDELVSE
jgi:hypothetical protein